MIMEKRKKISICSGTYNEETNIREFYERCLVQLKKFPQYDYEFVVADNCSTDRTKEIMREIAAEDKNFKCIFNANNFGPDRSTTNARHQATGDAVIMIVSDLQDPPEMIEEFIRKWEEGYKLVCAVKNEYSGNIMMNLVRRFYYFILDYVSEVKMIRNYHGFGLYDRMVVDAMKKFNNTVPYPRGLICEIGFKRCEVLYTQGERKNGKSSYNFLSYYDHAMTGFINYTKLPLRFAVFSGFFIAFLSFIAAVIYFIYKVCNWNSFQVGMAPLVIGVFFFSAVQLIFIGILGEYIGAIYSQVKSRPLVIEEERINFDDDSKE